MATQIFLVYSWVDQYGERSNGEVVVPLANPEGLDIEEANRALRQAVGEDRFFLPQLVNQVLGREALPDFSDEGACWEPEHLLDGLIQAQTMGEPDQPVATVAEIVKAFQQLAGRWDADGVTVRCIAEMALERGLVNRLRQALDEVEAKGEEA